MKIVPLGEIVTFKGGGTPDKSVPDYWGGNVPWASVKDFKSTSISRTTDYITQDGVRNSATNIVPAGTVIVPTRMAVGKAAICTIDVAINQDLKALLPSEHVETRYLLHALLASSKELERHATGATVKGITLDVLKNLRIPLPPRPEQRRIAAILDQADALRRLRRDSLDHLGNLGQAVFREIFGDLRSNSKSWHTARLGDLCELVRGSSPRPQGDPRYFGGPVPRLMIADITRDGKRASPRIDSLTLEGAKRSRPMDAGSVVMAVSGAVGLPAILAENACIHDGFVGFRDLSDALLPEFLYHYLVVQRAENSAKGTGAIWKNLTTDHVKEFVVPCPPLAEQQKFLAAIESIEAKEREIVAHSAKIDSLFASLQHRAFRGEL